jgi:hypothetical protein
MAIATKKYSVTDVVKRGAFIVAIEKPINSPQMMSERIKSVFI